MPPLKTIVSCPQCRQPVSIMLEQLFDVTQDPEAKRRFLNGQFNLINCPSCRYQGQAATLLLYHDADKEILMSYVPMTLGLPQAEQERAIGKLVNEVINKLPQEKRKGYLLNPRQALTLQGIADRVLEADGVTREMMDAQRAKAQLLQTLLTTPDEQLPAFIKEKDAEIDETTFQMLSASIQATAANGNQAAARRMMDLQNKLAEHSTIGQKLLARQQKVQDAVRELQQLGDQLNPNKLMELVLKADSDETLAAYVSLARPLIDYSFFESLTRRIDRAPAEEKAALTRKRDVILGMTQEMDEAAKARIGEATQALKKLLEARDLNKALEEEAGVIDDTFMAVLAENINAARKANRLDVLAQLNRVQEAINKLVEASAPPEVKFINQLLDLKTDAEAEAELKRRTAEITPELMQTLNYLAENMRQGGRNDLADRLEKLYGVALGEQMAANWRK
jgi:hypothetical protein